MLCVKKFNLIPNPKPFVIRSEIENTPNLSGMGRVGLVRACWVDPGRELDLPAPGFGAG